MNDIIKRLCSHDVRLHCGLRLPRFIFRLIQPSLLISARLHVDARFVTVRLLVENTLLHLHLLHFELLQLSRRILVLPLNLLQLLDDGADLRLGDFFNNSLAHGALLGLATTTHDARRLDEFALQGDDTALNVTRPGNLVRVLDGRHDERVTKHLVEDVAVLVLRLDEIKETLGSGHRLKVALHLLLLVENEQISTAEVVLSQVIDDRFCVLRMVDDDIIERPNSGR